MGRFKSNVLAQRPRHRPLRDSRDLDERLSGSLAAFKFANSAGLEKMRSDSFLESFRTPSDSFISKNDGMAKLPSASAALRGWQSANGCASYAIGVGAS